MAGSDSKQGFDPLKAVLAVIFFVFCYAMLFFIGSAASQISNAVSGIPVVNLLLPIPPVWDPPGNPIGQISMMNLLLPALGFVIIFLGTDWLEKFFETKHAKTIVFPVVFIIFCLGAFFIANYWMAMESANLNHVALSQVIPDFWSYFWGSLRESAFYLFLLGGLLGWISKAIIDRIKL
ncbi:MAG: hypothetical protein PHH08_01910 [Candidatus ainarchaeum sp.]|nr:hypothetical protein [Candidatus ainarchaeum sp.]